MATCTRCDRPAVWRAGLRLGPQRATVHRDLCASHGDAAATSEVVRLVSLVRIDGSDTEAVTIAGDAQVMTRSRPLQRRLTLRARSA